MVGPGTAGTLGGGELGEPSGAGLVGAFGALDPGDVAGAAAGELAGEGEGGGLEAGAPCAVGEPVGGGLSCSAGARAPILAKSWPMRIFPRKTGRLKM